MSHDRRTGIRAHINGRSAARRAARSTLAPSFSHGAQNELVDAQSKGVEREREQTNRVQLDPHTTLQRKSGRERTASLCTRYSAAADDADIHLRQVAKMKILLDHPGRPQGKRDRKSRKILKKMAKLERKLGKYSLTESHETGAVATSDDEDEDSSSSCADGGEPLWIGKRRRTRRRGCDRFRSCSSARSSSSSSSSNSSRASSRSPSPQHRHRRHHHHHRRHGGHLSRARSFAGQRSCSPIPGQQRHRCHRRHRCQDVDSERRRRRGSSSGGRPCRGSCAYRILAQSEPSLPDVQTEKPAAERTGSVVESPVRMEEDVQIAQENAEDRSEIGSADGPEMDEGLAKNWAEILQTGLQVDRKDLLKKYPVNRFCRLLCAPKTNEEILPIARKAGDAEMEFLRAIQYEIGAGLTALARAIGKLNGISEPMKNEDVTEILENLNDSAMMMLDVHRNMSIARKRLIIESVSKKIQAILRGCPTDEYLFGKDLEEKLKNVKGFGKCKKSSKERHRPEERCEKAGKRKHSCKDADKRKAKRLDTSDPSN